MMKYPIGVQSFEQIIKDGYVYVDKTALIYDLVTRGKIYFSCFPHPTAHPHREIRETPILGVNWVTQT